MVLYGRTCNWLLTRKVTPAFKSSELDIVSTPENIARYVVEKAFYEELKDMAQGDERILFTGFVQGQILEELYSNAYVYTLPSDLEGMPLSLLEAMSYGNCCLVSDIEECVSVVNDKAIVFPKSDINVLAEKLQFICDNENIVMSYKSKSSQYICNRYNWEQSVDKTLKLYTNMH